MYRLAVRMNLTPFAPTCEPIRRVTSQRGSIRALDDALWLSIYCAPNGHNSLQKWRRFFREWNEEVGDCLVAAGLDTTAEGFRDGEIGVLIALKSQSLDLLFPHVTRNGIDESCKSP